MVFLLSNFLFITIYLSVREVFLGQYFNKILGEI